VLPAIVKEPLLHWAISDPAFAAVGNALFVNNTSSVDDVQFPLLIVHRNVAVEPAAKPVTVVVGEDGVVIVTVPLIIVHTPVPTVGVLPAIVKKPLLHWAMSDPAFAVVGKALLVNNTSSVDEHAPLVIVQRKVAVVPAAKPVTVVVGEEDDVIVTEPLITVHAPVPTVGVFPAIVKEPLLHWTISDPASDVVGKTLLFVMTTSSVEIEQFPLFIVHRNVAEPPAARSVTVVVGEDASAIVTDPLTTDQVPVPTEGVFPAIVKEPLLHWAISTPAFAVVAVIHGLRTRNIAALRSDADSVTVPFPVAPAVDLIAQAPPTEASSPSVVTLSKSSVNEDGLVAVQPE
jgi:hypothetical protein